jgi:NAD-dependent deacetylase
MSDADEQRAARWLAEADRVAVLTGAGISTESGIPDFRGPNGLWTTNPEAERASTLQHYLADPEVRRQSWQSRLEHAVWQARPNRGHLALVELERRNLLLAVVTQNVDGLHQAAGSSPDRVIEVHGTVHRTMCWGCGDRRPMTAVLTRVAAGEQDPPCEVCGGILKSDTISFGQALVPEVIDRAMRVSEECDVFLAVGTMLSVFPVANTVLRARAAGARIIIVNGTPTEMDDRADAVLRGQIGELLPRLLGIVSPPTGGPIEGTTGVASNPD